MKPSEQRRQERDIKFAIAEIYLKLKKVEVYQELNYTGIYSHTHYSLIIEINAGAQKYRSFVALGRLAFISSITEQYLPVYYFFLSVNYWE